MKTLPKASADIGNELATIAYLHPIWWLQNIH